MKDKLERTIDYMRVSITDRCNLRCRYCMPEGVSLLPAEQILTYEEIECICRAAAELGIRKIKVTGGEPLVRSGCARLIGRLKRIPGIEQVTLTTNGVLLGEYLPELLEGKLDAVNISLDTLDPDRYEKITGQREMKTVLRNIKLAVRFGLPVKVNVVLQKGVNENEWMQLAHLARDLQADVRFIEMMPIGAGRGYEAVSNKELLKKFREYFPGLEQDHSIHGNGPAVYYRIPEFQGSIGFISAIHGNFCGSCNRIRLTSQGKLKPCLCYSDSVDLRGILRKENVNKTAEDSTEKEQNSEEEIQEKRKEELKEVIRRAVQRKPARHLFESENEVTERCRMVQIGG